MHHFAQAEQFKESKDTMSAQESIEDTISKFKNNACSS